MLLPLTSIYHQPSVLRKATLILVRFSPIARVPGLLHYLTNCMRGRLDGIPAEFMLPQAGAKSLPFLA